VYACRVDPDHTHIRMYGICQLFLSQNTISIEMKTWVSAF